MPLSQTKRSTRKLSEVARHVVIPSGIVTSGWAPVEARCAEFGDEFDEWQRGAGRVILGKRESGEYAATVGGITLSIPRQVAKTFLVMRIVVALCTLFPGLTVLWTAHRTRTATKTFGSMRGFVSRPAVARYLRATNPIRSANGEQEIVFANGSTIMFGAREQGFGRGFDEVDIEVFDEAQILTEKALEDMVAATNQSRFPAGALLFFMGTPPRPVDPGEAFRARRVEALQFSSAPFSPSVGEDALYIECSADADADPDDREQWSLANPSYPHRTPLRSMLRLRKNLPSADSWRREALGIWDDDSTTGDFPAGVWQNAKSKLSGVLSDAVVAVDIRMGLQQSVAISSVGSRGGETVAMVGRYERGAGKQWSEETIVDWVAAELSSRGIVEVVIDGYGENGTLLPLLEQRGLKVVKFNTVDMRNACMGFHGAVLNGQLKHSGDAPLDVAVLGARRRKSGEGWLWSRPNSVADISPLMAAAAAWWAYTSRPRDYDVLDSFY